MAAAIVGTPSQVYGSAPTASLGYTLTGFVDSEDNALNVVTGAATYSTALSSAMNAGIYSITYTSGLTSANYTLAASTTGAAYTVTPAIINLSATRTYDAATDAAASIFGSGGTVSGVNGQTLILSGSGTLAGKNVGSEAVVLARHLEPGQRHGLASNYTLIGGTDTVDRDTRNPDLHRRAASESYGTTPSGLSGHVSGFVGSDTLGNATTGSAVLDHRYRGEQRRPIRHHRQRLDGRQRQLQLRARRRAMPRHSRSPPQSSISPAPVPTMPPPMRPAASSAPPAR